MKDNRITTIFYCLGGIAVIWIALIIAPYTNGGILEIIKQVPQKINDNPFCIDFCENSIKTILIFLFLYILSIGIYISTKRNYRKGKEYGSAIWGITKQINKKYKQIPNNQNKILTQNVSIGLKAKKHRRNLNILVCGGSGSGKTRFFGKPNIMQCNCSYVILDPKGEILRDTGYLLEKEHYKVKILDLVTPKKSHCYNPFVYLKDDNDVQKLVTNLFKSTTPKRKPK